MTEPPVQDVVLPVAVIVAVGPGITVTTIALDVELPHALETTQV